MEGRAPLTAHRGRIKREITVESWTLDGRFVFEARLRDAWFDPETGEREPIHEYDVRLVAEPPDLTVISVDAAPGTLPFPECPGAARAAERLIGLRLTRGFRDGAIAALGAVEGCTHLLTLVLAIWSEQVVNNYMAARSPEPDPSSLERRAGMLNVCSGWREGGTAIELTRRGEHLPRPAVQPAPGFSGP